MFWGLSEADSPIHGTFEVSEDMFGTFEVALGGVLEVGGQEAGGGGDVRAGAEADPVEAANQGTVGCDEVGFGLRWEPIMGIPVNEVTAAVGSGDGIGVREAKVVEELVDVARLRAVDGKAAIRGGAPFVVDAEVVRQVAHEIYSETGAEGIFKPCLGGIVGAKVYAVINVGAEE
jgi:hypothetical protein